MFKNQIALLSALLLLSVALAACGGEGPEIIGSSEDGNEPEVITTLELAFSPLGEGNVVVFEFDDPDGAGGDTPQSDVVALAAGTDYEMTARFFNKLARPTRDVTPEIRDEAEDHQFFVLGADVSGPATNVAPSDGLVVHTYADAESDYGPNAVGDDLPLGLVNLIETVGVGDGDFRVVLRHIPPRNEVALKVPGLEQEVAAHGVAALPGATDIDVTFRLRVEE